MDGHELRMDAMTYSRHVGYPSDDRRVFRDDSPTWLSEVVWGVGAAVRLVMIRVLCSAGVCSVLLAGGSTCSAAQASAEERLVIVARGASGTEEYGKLFDVWAERWAQATREGGGQLKLIGSEKKRTELQDEVVSQADFEELKSVVREWSQRSPQSGELWVVLIGHGTFDGRTARFNLRGRDVSARQFEEWLAPVRTPVAFINCTSCSAPFLKRLAGPERVLVTATKSGSEQNFARFGEFLSLAIGDIRFDLDKDGQTSLLEAFLAASRRTEEFYETEGRLTTEHALLDDNGDGSGVRADWFRGVRVIRKSASGAEIDWQRAHQLHLKQSDLEKTLSPEMRRERDRIELAVITLRDRKESFAEPAEYYSQLEKLLVALAEIYERRPDPVSAETP